MEEETHQTPNWEAGETDSPPTAPPQAHRKISRTGSIPVIQPSGQAGVELGDLMESTELAELSNEIPVEQRKSASNLEEDEDSWEKLYNETGDLLRPEALEEVSIRSPLTFDTCTITAFFLS